MAITRQKKEEVLNELTEQLSKARSVVFTDMAGLKVSETNELRQKCRDEDVECVVAKKTLMKLAFEQAGYEGIDPLELEGSLSVMMGMGDEVAPAKLAAEFGKDHEALEIVAGVLDKELVDASAIKALAKLPSKHELRGQVVGTIAAPLSGFVNVLQGNIRGLVQALNAVKEQKA